MRVPGTRLAYYIVRGRRCLCLLVRSPRKMFWKQIESEMPAFIYHVLNEHKISDELADSEEERMGVRGYHHPKALNYVETYSSDGSRLLGIIEC